MEVLGATSLSIDNSIDNTFEGISKMLPLVPRRMSAFNLLSALQKILSHFKGQGSFQAILSHFEATLSHFCGDFMVV